MNEQEFAELAAGYALNALSPADREIFHTVLAEHPEWEPIVRMDAATVATLAESIEPIAPPLNLRSTLLSRIASTPQVPGDDVIDVATSAPTRRLSRVDPAPEDVAWADAPDDLDEPDHADEPSTNTATVQAISRRNWSRGLFSLAASLVLLVAVGFGAVSLNQWINRPAAIVALDEIEQAPDSESATVAITDGGVATAHWSGSLGKAVIVADGLPAITSDETFELWLVRDGGAVSAGTFDPTDDDSATALLAGSIVEGDTIAMTVEEAGGSATGAPTSTPIVAIPTV